MPPSLDGWGASRAEAPAALMTVVPLSKNSPAFPTVGRRDAPSLGICAGVYLFRNLPLGSRTESLSAGESRQREQSRASGPTGSWSLLILWDEALDYPEKRGKTEIIVIYLFFPPSPGVGLTSKGPTCSSSIRGFFSFFSMPNYRFERCCLRQLCFFFFFSLRKQSIAPLMEIASFKRRLRQFLKLKKNLCSRISGNDCWRPKRKIENMWTSLNSHCIFLPAIPNYIWHYSFIWIISNLNNKWLKSKSIFGFCICHYHS